MAENGKVIVTGCMGASRRRSRGDFPKVLGDHRPAAIRRGVMATGGSTNAVLHLIAVAKEAGVKLAMAEFDRISRKTRSSPT